MSAAKDPDEALFALAEELRRLSAESATLVYAELAARHGVSEAEVEACLAALQGLDAALGEDPAPSATGSPEAPPVAPPGYELLSELGRGGMGVVWRARELGLGRTVALKLLRPGDRVDELLRRFEREAQALARLRHPHLVAVHEVGRVDGGLFFTMDLIDGTSLAELLARDGALNPARAVEVLRQVASAVAHSHAQGIVHRDLKPGNVLINDEGRAFVVDFGLALDMKANDALTGTGLLLGTPAYMSPEQACGARELVGEPSDVHALGALLYECLTGRRPFSARSLAETLHAVIHTPPKPPRELDPRIPRELEAVCLKALEKDPSARYGGARGFLEDLERFLAGQPVLARRPGRARRAWAWARRRPAAAALVLQGLLLVLGLLGWQVSLALERWRRERETWAEHGRFLEREASQAREWVAWVFSDVRPETPAAVAALASARGGEARRRVGDMLVKGVGLPADPPRGIELLVASARAGDENAMELLTDLTYGSFTAGSGQVDPLLPPLGLGRRGLELPRLAERSPEAWRRLLELLETAALEGDVWAHSQLARYFSDDEGDDDPLPDDLERAVDHAVAAVEASPPDSRVMSRRGGALRGVWLHRTRDLLATRLEERARAGSAPAAVALGWTLWEGSSFRERDAERAIRAWMRALELGADPTGDLARMMVESPAQRQAVLSALETTGRDCARAARFLTRYYSGEMQLKHGAPPPDPERGAVWKARADALERR